MNISTMKLVYFTILVDVNVDNNNDDDCRMCDDNNDHPCIFYFFLNSQNNDDDQDDNNFSQSTGGIHLKFIEPVKDSLLGK
ncbi:hypothetical protein DERP_014108 [Dermatophagoides pteronyssinus]|uniref:Uncharacterized protein n=1 Tax=Dermatophagoides pteronyssinus TaxID=6956 RepID=A0ABQ8IXC1_DERPT|nr:hypothetical protein DERP_014108 [Dermatophagoides pteronyssinus]